MRAIQGLAHERVLAGRSWDALGEDTCKLIADRRDLGLGLARWLTGLAFGALSLVPLVALAADPPTTPMLRLETGMHTASHQPHCHRRQRPVAGHGLGRQDRPGVGDRIGAARERAAPAAGGGRMKASSTRWRSRPTGRRSRWRGGAKSVRQVTPSTSSIGPAAGCCGVLPGCRTSSITSPTPPTDAGWRQAWGVTTAYGSSRPPAAARPDRTRITAVIPTASTSAATAGGW